MKAVRFLFIVGFVLVVSIELWPFSKTTSLVADTYNLVYNLARFGENLPEGFYLATETPEGFQPNTSYFMGVDRPYLEYGDDRYYLPEGLITNKGDILYHGESIGNRSGEAEVANVTFQIPENARSAQVQCELKDGWLICQYGNFVYFGDTFSYQQNPPERNWLKPTISWEKWREMSPTWEGLYHFIFD